MGAFNKDFIQYSDKKVKEETKNLALYFILHISLYIVILFFAIFFAWYTVFISTHKFYAVKGVSMMGTLNSQITEEQLLTDVYEAQKLSFDAVYVDKTTAPRLFDIIVVEESNNSVIKRLMATEGDYITIAKGKTEGGQDCFYFYRIPNGTQLSEFSDEQARVLEDGQNGYSIYNSKTLWTHHNASQKSYDISVEVDQTIKTHSYEYNFYKTFLKDRASSTHNYYVSENGLIYVQVPKGKVFYMGDNREYSSDCRETGFCDAKDIVGRAEFIVYNYNFGNRLWEVVKFYFSEAEKFFAR